MRLRKRFLNLDVVQRLLGALIVLYVFLVYRTGRWSVAGREHPQPFWDSEKNFIVGFWHGRLMMLPYAWESARPFVQLNSAHRDGMLSIRAQEHFGFETIIGSASAGAVAALRGLLKAVRSGKTIGIALDGPRGPRMRAKLGAVMIASKTGVPILPVAFSSARYRLLASWDRFFLPALFSRGHIAWGDPIHVPKGLDEAGLERYRQQVEDRLYALTVAADAAYGHPAIPKAPAPKAPAPKTPAPKTGPSFQEAGDP